MKKSFKGFTLVEVLIVIIIVGILIAALLPRLIGSQARARDIARQGGVNQLSQAIALMIQDAGVLGTPSGAYCVNAPTVLTASVNGATATLSNYLATIPADPQNGNANGVQGTACAGNYVALVSTTGDAVMVVSNLETQNGANLADLATTVTGYTNANFATMYNAGGTDFFGVLVQ